MNTNSNLKEFRATFIYLFFELGLSSELVGKIMNLSYSTVKNYYDTLKSELKVKANTSATPDEKDLAMFALYIRVRHDSKTRNAIKELKGIKNDITQLLYVYLRLDECVTHISGFLTASRELQKLQFTKDVPVPYQDMIRIILERKEYTAKDIRRQAELLLREYTDAVYVQSKPLPTAADIKDPDSLAALVAKPSLEDIEIAPVFGKEFFSELTKEMKELTSKRHKVLTDYFGLDGAEKKGLEEIATKLDLTRERTRQIKDSAVRLVRTVVVRLFNKFQVPLENRISEDREHTKQVDELNKRIFELTTRTNVMQAQLLELNVVEGDIGKTTESLLKYNVAFLTQKIEDLNLSVRAYNCVKYAKFDYAWQLCEAQAIDFLKFRNFGKKSLVEIEGILIANNCSFGMEFSKELHDYLVFNTFTKDRQKAPAPREEK